MWNFGNKYSFSAAGYGRAYDIQGRPHLAKKLVWNGAISAFVGAILGIIGSLVVNCTLVEISLSSFFALYFGVLFISVGGVLIWRLTVNVTEEAQTRKLQLLFFAAMTRILAYTSISIYESHVYALIVAQCYNLGLTDYSAHLCKYRNLWLRLPIVLSGLMCFVLKNNWFLGLNALVKLPIYTLLGVSIAFALTFSIVDMMNYLVGYFHVSAARSLVESKAQVYLVLGMALTMGGIFGFIFGILDVEDAASYQMKLALLREEHYCYPVGAILGALAGFGNEFLRVKDEIKSSRWQTEFDDEV